MAVRAVRGATQLEDDVREHMLERVAEMVTGVMEANDLDVDDFISVIFTATSDLVSEFPAYAARRLGFGEIPLICARPTDDMPRWTELADKPRVVRRGLAFALHQPLQLDAADVAGMAGDACGTINPELAIAAAKHPEARLAGRHLS